MQFSREIHDELRRMSSDQRPLSPHLQVYRPQITSVLSILHRITGVALALGTLVLVWWLVAAGTSAAAFATAQSIIGSWYGMVLMVGWTFALFFHLCNGVRHLVWDTGRGFEVSQVTASGWAAVAISAGLTIVAWIAGLSVGGGG